MQFDKQTAANEINSLLKKEYGYNLLGVAYLIATVFLEEFALDLYSLHGIRIRCAINKLTKISQEFRGTLRVYYSNFDYLGIYNSFSKEQKEMYIDSNFKSTFEKFDQMKKEMETNLTEPGYIFRWRPLKKKGIIASLLKMNWDDRVRLFDWFYTRLQGACYRDELKVRRNYSEEIRLLKRAEKRIVKRNPVGIVILRHLFVPEERFHALKSSQGYFYMNGITFGINTIGISIISKDEKNEFLIEGKYVNSKLLFSANVREINFNLRQASPYIYFPNGQKISIVK
jgi:hypothetical protein